MLSDEFKENFHHYKTYKHFISDLEQDINSRDRNHGHYFDLVESELIEDEKRITELLDSYKKIKEHIEILSEKKCVYEKNFQLINTNSEISIVLDQQEMRENPMIIEEGFSSELNLLAGVIKAENDLKMKKMIFRVSRGRAIATFFDYNDIDIDMNNSIYKQNSIKKKIFTIFFQGGNQNVILHNKLLNICDLFGASRYNMPRRDQITNVIKELQSEIVEKKHFLREAEYSIKDFLKYKTGSSSQPGKFELYKMYFRKEKLIYINLSKCHVRGNFIDGEVWVLEKNYSIIEGIFKDLNKDQSRVPVSFTHLEENSTTIKPTYIPTNEFTWAFQEIVDTYGIPRYSEINPTYFNIVTFPFLFGIMFGDIGHGFIVFMLGIYLCLANNKSERGTLKMVFKARYLILLMGFFSFYSGWIYNDFLSVPLPVFGTCYENKLNVTVPYAIKKYPSCVYPIGLDPKWSMGKNELSFINSMKMKLSVIFGVLQMLFGVFLKGLNDIHFKNFSGLICETIPQFIFMGLLFGYMDVMIFIKWSTDWTSNTGQAPSVISLLMNIFLKFGSVKNQPLWGGKNGLKFIQEEFHQFVLFACLILVPIMLFPKPIIEYCKTRNKSTDQIKHILSDEETLVSGISNEINHEDTFSIVQEEHHDESHSFGEIFIHQTIQTIEFVLGSVSNTASYLRLWALSLAHGELSKVFFEKTIGSGIRSGNFSTGFIQIFIGFFLFANITFVVLLCMDFMECFLHTLRLHWVEFQNKFYKADGYKFNPYSFKYIIETDKN